MSEITRRQGLKLIAATVGCRGPASADEVAPMSSTPPSPKASAPARDVVTAQVPLGFPWATRDPFLFCVHHQDDYPAGDARLAPVESVAGRDLGMDFTIKDGWRMYHGQTVPGFPQHPHRGFETVTAVRRGLIDHADSMGAAARYGDGDVQWLTAGQGIQHAEMFPLVHREARNPTDFFQIWLNLPAARKMVEPYFKMLWSPSIPRTTVRDAAGRETRLEIFAGRYQDHVAPAPPPNSWAAAPKNEVAIWAIDMAAGAQWTLPPAKPGVNRSLYFFVGEALTVNGRAVKRDHRIDLVPDQPAALVASAATRLLLLGGRPIGEPVAQQGPFVMNSRAEVQQAYLDYRRTQFGGWPWPVSDPVHGADPGRFARRPDGAVERPT